MRYPSAGRTFTAYSNDSDVLPSSIVKRSASGTPTLCSGHGIATTIQQTSEDVLLIDHGSLYPALQRLERAGLISSDWGTSDNNRRARFYKLTKTGRARLTAETSKWEKMVRAVSRVLKPQDAS